MKQRCFYILAFLSINLLTCCTKSNWSDDCIIDGDYEAYTLNAPYIDEYGNEGVIAYISEKEGEIKYIIAISLDEGYESWGPMGEAVYKVDSINFDTISNYYFLYQPAFGLMMMQSMKSIGIERFPAQNWCDKKNIGDPYPNASSWRLPTYYELRLVFSNKGLSNALTQAGGDPLYNNYYYWTCVEDIENYMTFDNIVSDYDRENRAINMNPKGNAYVNKDYWLKKNKYHVRAIKYVYYKI